MNLPFVTLGKRLEKRGRTGVALTRLFNAFPDGRIGLGLLVLRVALGVTVMMQGRIVLTGGSDAGSAAWFACLLGVAAGILLLIGLLTPIAAGAAAFAGAGIGLTVGFVTVVALAMVLLGPGAYSLDARLFGLREIIIPSRNSQ